MGLIEWLQWAVAILKKWDSMVIAPFSESLLADFYGKCCPQYGVGLNLEIEQAENGINIDNTVHAVAIDSSATRRVEVEDDESWAHWSLGACHWSVP